MNLLLFEESIIKILTTVLVKLFKYFQLLTMTYNNFYVVSSYVNFISKLISEFVLKISQFHPLTPSNICNKISQPNPFILDSRFISQYLMNMLLGEKYKIKLKPVVVHN